MTQASGVDGVSNLTGATVCAGGASFRAEAPATTGQASGGRVKSNAAVPAGGLNRQPLAEAGAGGGAELGIPSHCATRGASSAAPAGLAVASGRAKLRPDALADASPEQSAALGAWPQLHERGSNARLLARLAVARVRLLDATTLRDRRAKELRELIDLAHDALRSRTASARLSQSGK